MTLMLFKLVDSPVMLMICQNTSFYTRFSSASINTKDLPNALVSSSPFATFHQEQLSDAPTVRIDGGSAAPVLM